MTNKHGHYHLIIIFVINFMLMVIQDIGGSPTLFGVASVINHISEIFAYFFSFKLITQMGHVKVTLSNIALKLFADFLYL